MTYVPGMSRVWLSAGACVWLTTSARPIPMTYVPGKSRVWLSAGACVWLTISARPISMTYVPGMSRVWLSAGVYVWLTTSARLPGCQHQSPVDYLKELFLARDLFPQTNVTKQILQSLSASFSVLAKLGQRVTTLQHRRHCHNVSSDDPKSG